jgi:hypothetical protein
MAWPDQNPPSTDVLLHVNVPCSGGGAPAYLEIDKLPGGRYRATVGTLFEHQEICRTNDLEGLMRQANAMASCRSFGDVVRAIRAMRACGLAQEEIAMSWMAHLTVSRAYAKRNGARLHRERADLPAHAGAAASLTLP